MKKGECSFGRSSIGARVFAAVSVVVVALLGVSALAGCVAVGGDDELAQSNGNPSDVALSGRIYALVSASHDEVKLISTNGDVARLGSRADLATLVSERRGDADFDFAGYVIETSQTSDVIVPAASVPAASACDRSKGVCASAQAASAIVHRTVRDLYTRSTASFPTASVTLTEGGNLLFATSANGRRRHVEDGSIVIAQFIPREGRAHALAVTQSIVKHPAASFFSTTYTVPENLRGTPVRHGPLAARLLGGTVGRQEANVLLPNDEIMNQVLLVHVEQPGVPATDFHFVPPGMMGMFEGHSTDLANWLRDSSERLVL